MRSAVFTSFQTTLTILWLMFTIIHLTTKEISYILMTGGSGVFTVLDGLLEDLETIMFSGFTMSQSHYPNVLCQLCMSFALTLNEICRR